MFWGELNNFSKLEIPTSRICKFATDKRKKFRLQDSVLDLPSVSRNTANNVVTRGWLKPIQN